MGGEPCGSSSVTNTDTITFLDSSGSNTSFHVDLGAGALAPGLTDEPGESDEIELTADFGSGGYDEDALFVAGCPTSCAAPDDHVAWGTSGINLNADEPPTVDVDVTAVGVESYLGLGGIGDDVLDASGGFGTGAGLPIGIGLFGDAGMDSLTGGGGDDTLHGDDDADDLKGAAGNDSFVPGLGDDQVEGGEGDRDLVSFGVAPNGVSVDLAEEGPQATGEGSDSIVGVEDLFGSNFSDPILSGTPAANVIGGLYGDDRILGLGGDDSLSGNGGDDVFDGGADDTAGDTMRGGRGSDTAEYAAGAVEVDLKDKHAQQTGGGGVDTLKGIENLLGGVYADALRGDTANNSIDGNDGDDYLNGRNGKDLLNGGAGADVVQSRDGETDKVDCGPGHDVAKADGKDKLRGCEVERILSQ